MSNCITFCCTTPAFVLSCRKRRDPHGRPGNTGEHLGQNLRRARAQAGLSQREVAQHLGVSRPTYTYYETGHTAPSVFDLYRLAQLYGCPMEDFLR